MADGLTFSVWKEFGEQDSIGRGLQVLLRNYETHTAKKPDAIALSYPAHMKLCAELNLGVGATLQKFHGFKIFLIPWSRHKLELVAVLLEDTEKK